MNAYKTQFNFGKHLKKLRKRRGLTQQELAKAVGLTVRAISYYETENRYPRGEFNSLFSRALCVSVEEFLGHKNLSEMPNDGKLWKKLKVMEKMTPSEQKKVFDIIHLIQKSKKS